MLRKTAPFLLLFALLNLPNISAQDLKNRTEEMYPFGTVIISAESLPDKVYQSQKNKILISVLFIEKGTDNIIINSVGSGFVPETPGIVITARHLLDKPLIDVEQIKSEKIKFNSKFDFEYIFMGTIITDTAWINFPLYLAAVGEKGTFKDIMALRTDVATMEKARMPGDFTNPNPYAILLKTSKFADTDVGKKVYISGFAPVVAEYFNKNNQSVPIYIDLINFTFPAEITAPVGNIPIGNKTGLKNLFRLRDSAEPGFSGGKVMNGDGQVVGMTIAMSKNFVYVISSKDIKDSLKDNKLR